MIIGVAAVLTRGLPLVGPAADSCGLCQSSTAVEHCSRSATRATHSGACYEKPIYNFFDSLSSLLEQ
jgi:hypothetical protein